MHRHGGPGSGEAFGEGKHIVFQGKEMEFSRAAVGSARGSKLIGARNINRSREFFGGNQN